MSYRSRVLILSLGLNALALAILVIHRPERSNLDWAGVLVFTGLVAVMLNLGTMAENVIPPLAPAAVMAYLTLGTGSSVGSALWSVLAGLLMGHVGWSLRVQFVACSRRDWGRLWRSLSLGSAQLIVSLFLGGKVYAALAGRLPLNRLEWKDIPAVAAVLGVVFAALLTLTILEFTLARHHAPRASVGRWLSAIPAMVLPLPVAMVGAVTYHQMSAPVFVNLAASLLIVAAGVIFYGRAQQRAEQQLAELRLLSAIGRTIHSGRNVNVVLSVVAEQVTHLLGVGSLTIALYDANRRMIHFPLNMRRHRSVPLEPRPTNGGLIEYVIQTREPLLIEDRVNERAHSLGLIPPAPPAYSWMGVPLVGAGERVWGCITVVSSHPNRLFSPKDLHLLTMVGAQTGIVLDNAQLNRLARDRSMQLATLHIARDRMQVILDTMKEAIILIDGEGCITLANPRVQPLLGLDPLEIVGRTVTDLVNDPALCLAERLGFDPAALLALVNDVCSGTWDDSSELAHKTLEMPSAANERYLDRTLTLARDEGGAAAGLLMAFADVTEERALAQARQDLSSMIVHDLRGPLTAISASLKLLNEIAPPGDSLGRVIQQTTEASARAMRKLLSLVDSLLDVSKMESGAMDLNCEPVMLRKMCAAVLDDLTPAAHELDVALKMDLADDLPLLNVDVDKVERVLLNLVDNAIKFSPVGGVVTVRAAYPSPESRYLKVEVVDNGPGIPDEHKERLFNRFAQLGGQRGRRRGTGLGLTFCKLAVEAHKGKVWVEDNPQGGSIFVFTLPVAEVDELVLPQTG